MNDECREKGREEAREEKGKQTNILCQMLILEMQNFFTKRWDYPRLTNKCVFIF